MKTLRLILGDQLNLHHSWFEKTDDHVFYLMAEMRQETDYVKHHIQKVVAFFLSMRTFAAALRQRGHQVVYVEIDDPENRQELEVLIGKFIQQYSIDTFEYQLPDEYRLDQQLQEITSRLNIASQAYDSEHFYTHRLELAEFFKGKKMFLMETFYRQMRKKYELLMLGDQPLGGQWNYDQDNRKTYKGEVPVPQAITFPKAVDALLEQIQKSGVVTFGSIDPNQFPWPTSREECLAQLDYFCSHLLRHFGDYEDTMHTEQKNLFHSRLSFAMNSKMISPKEVIHRVLHYYESHQDDISLSQVEGFVRQIVGWREYIRGIYWKQMPEYAQKNGLENHYPLPEFFWTGKTKMNCLKHALCQSLEDAYAHHIQRLMIIGNFALLTQRHPDEVDAWYLGVYIDAIEWVEMPNTRGMSQYADGGILATKPYVSSGSYINKMSNYCKVCHYNVKEKLGETACPFNSLYWNFLDDKKAHFKNNQRMGMMLNLLQKIKPDELAGIKQRAHQVISDPDRF